MGSILYFLSSNDAEKGNDGAYNVIPDKRCRALRDPESMCAVHRVP